LPKKNLVLLHRIFRLMNFRPIWINGLIITTTNDHTVDIAIWANVRLKRLKKERRIRKEKRPLNQLTEETKTVREDLDFYILNTNKI